MAWELKKVNACSKLAFYGMLGVHKSWWFAIKNTYAVDRINILRVFAQKEGPAFSDCLPEHNIHGSTKQRIQKFVKRGFAQAN